MAEPEKYYASPTPIGVWNYCRRKRFLEYHAKGIGIQKAGMPIGLSAGLLFHKMLEGVTKYIVDNEKTIPEKAFDEVITACQKNYTKECEVNPLISSAPEAESKRLAVLTEGLARGWVHHRLPQLLERYEIITSEKEEWITLGDGVKIMRRSDAVLKRRVDGALFVMDFKTTGSRIDNRFLEDWRFDIAWNADALSVEQNMGKPCMGVLIELVQTGGRNKTTKEAINHPTGEIPYSRFVRGYRYPESPVNMARGISGGATTWVYSLNPIKGKFSEGFELSSGASLKEGDYPGGVKAWVAEKITDEVFQETFFYREIMITQTEVERWAKQTSAQELFIREGLEVMKTDPEGALDRYFPGNFDQGCNHHPKYRNKCDMFGCCFGNKGVDDLINDGTHKQREPHYEKEIEGRKQNGSSAD
jgi:hypothetical protein